MTRPSDVLRARGWTQHELTGPGERVCLLGAVAYARGLLSSDTVVTYDRLRADPFVARAAQVIREQYPDWPLHVDATPTDVCSAWNDDPSRDEAQVLAVLEKAETP